MIVLTALIWAVLHRQYDLFDMANIFAAGLLFGCARLRTNSIYPCLLMHGLMNLIATIEVAMVIRTRHPSAAWIRVRFPSDYISRTAEFVDLVSVRDAGGCALGGIGPTLAAEATVLLRDVQRVCPGLLGRPAGDDPLVVRVDLPPVPANE